MSLKHGEVGGTVISLPVIGPRLARGTWSSVIFICYYYYYVLLVTLLKFHPVKLCYGECLSGPKKKIYISECKNISDMVIKVVYL